MMLLLLLGCIPSEIPREDAPITAGTLPDLVSASSPDLPVLFYQVVAQLAAEGYRDCPVVDTSSMVSIYANNCADASGWAWDGSADAIHSGGSTEVTFTNFRVESQETMDGWVVNGWITATEATGGVRLRSKLKVTSLDLPERVLWIDTTGGYFTSDGILYVEDYTGRVGFQDLGLVDIDGARIAAGQANGCSYADHFTGTLAIEGTREAEVHFAFQFPDFPDTGGETGDTGDTADTGDTDDSGDTGETGGTGETGDTADTGTSDTGDTSDTSDTADTADTGTSDTSDTSGPADTSEPADTADTGFPRFYVPYDSGLRDTGVRDTGGGQDGGGEEDEGPELDFNPDDGGGVCGTCADIYVDGELLVQCHTADRTLAWPFQPPL